MKMLSEITSSTDQEVGIRSVEVVVARPVSGLPTDRVEQMNAELQPLAHKTRRAAQALLVCSILTIGSPAGFLAFIASVSILCNAAPGNIGMAHAARLARPLSKAVTVLCILGGIFFVLFAGGCLRNYDEMKQPLELEAIRRCESSDPMPMPFTLFSDTYSYSYGGPEEPGVVDEAFDSYDSYDAKPIDLQPDAMPIVDYRGFASPAAENFPIDVVVGEHHIPEMANIIHDRPPATNCEVHIERLERGMRFVGLLWLVLWLMLLTASSVTAKLCNELVIQARKSGVVAI